MIPSFIGLFFALLWLIVGAGELAGRAAIIVTAIGVLLLLFCAWRIVRRGRRRGRFHRGYYVAAVAAEIVAIMAAQQWLAAHGRNNLLLPVVGVIVGLHFIGLWISANDRRFLWLSAAMVVVNAAALLLPLSQSGRIMLSGFGSSVALLVSAAA